MLHSVSESISSPLMTVSSSLMLMSVFAPIVPMRMFFAVVVSANFLISIICSSMFGDSLFRMKVMLLVFLGVRMTTYLSVPVCVTTSNGLTGLFFVHCCTSARRVFSCSLLIGHCSIGKSFSQLPFSRRPIPFLVNVKSILFR